MNKVWVCVALLESGEKYIYVYDFKPTKDQIWRRVWEDEGQYADLEFYEGTCNFLLQQCEVDSV